MESLAPIVPPATNGADPVALAERRAASQVALELPIRSLPTWGLPDVAAALIQHELGQFSLSALLAEALTQDPSIKGPLETRVRGLTGVPLTFLPADGSRRARKIAAQAQEEWSTWVAPEEAEVFRRWRLLMGCGVGQLLWDTAGQTWQPSLNLWHLTNLYWYWDWRRNYGRWQLITTGGVIEPIPGDGQWVFGKATEKRPQMEGLVRTLAVRYVGRVYGLQGWGRYNEVHGLPIAKAIMPAQTSEEYVQSYKNQLSGLGSQQVIALRQGDVGNKFDFLLEEAKADTYETFKDFLDATKTEIQILLLGQNLTSEVKGGSRAAATVHDRVRLDLLESDARAEERLYRQQVLKPWAAINHGDPNLAPRLQYETAPVEDKASAATRISNIAAALANFEKAGVIDQIDVPRLLQGADIPLKPEIEAELAGEKALKASEHETLIRNRRLKSRTHVSTVAVFDAEGRMLFGRRKDDGTYTEPGGHAYPDEDPVECALRELKEETGLTPDEFAPLGGGLAGPDGDVHVTVYRAVVSGTPTNEHDPDGEFYSFHWVDVSNGLPEEIAARLRHRPDVALDALGIAYRKPEDNQ